MLVLGEAPWFQWFDSLNFLIDDFEELDDKGL